MLCNACSKLVLMNSDRTCIRCKGGIFNNLAVICDNCSKTESICAVCIKKMIDPSIKHRVRSNCSSCGK